MSDPGFVQDLDTQFVLLDFFVRHGVLTPDNFRDFQELQSTIRTACNPYADVGRGG